MRRGTGWRRVGRHRTAFQDIEVWASDRAVEFRVAGAVHAWWHRDRFLTGQAWDNLVAAALLRPAGPPRSILMLGLAGGTSLRAIRHLLPDVRLVAVDLDPGIVALARRHMHLDGLRVETHLADAYAWLRAYRGPRFDVVIDDVYQALPHDVARPACGAGEVVQLLRRAVDRDGVAVANLVTGPGHRAVQSAFRKAFAARFALVRSVTTPEGLNEALVAGRAVEGRAALAGWRGRWAHVSDRRYWDALRVRSLLPPGTRPAR